MLSRIRLCGPPVTNSVDTRREFQERKQAYVQSPHWAVYTNAQLEFLTAL